MNTTTENPYSFLKSTLYRNKYNWGEVMFDNKDLKDALSVSSAPTRRLFGFAMIDGKPIHIIRGRTAVAYIDGKRTEVPVEFVSAESYPEALEKFTKSHREVHQVTRKRNQKKPLYHVTNPENLDSILKEGLLLEHDGYYAPYISLSEQPDSWMKEGLALLEVDIDGLDCVISSWNFPPDNLDEVCVWGDIPPERIKVLKQ